MKNSKTTSLAMVRTSLALHRTVLAYLRTCISFILGGFALIHYFTADHEYYNYMGYTFIGLAVLNFLVALLLIVKTRQETQQLEKLE